jgi:beta-glucanase (GH16 family)
MLRFRRLQGAVFAGKNKAMPNLALIFIWLRRSSVAWLSALSAFFLPSAGAVDDWQPGPGWKLVWNDEFNAAELDKRNWTFDLGGGGWGNNELERYTNERTNVFVANGELVIQAVKSGTNYTSARLKTQGLRSWTYGKMAARMKLPYGVGIWPAFWLLGNGITTVGWPRCGEVDIMELIGGGAADGTIYGTMHWQENGSPISKASGPYSLPKSQFFYQAYHVFEIEWSATNFVWKLDGAKYFTAPINPTAQPGTAAFQQPFFIILNLAVGGNWPGPPNSSTVFPQQLQVDWVRVYQPGIADEPGPKLEIQRSGNDVILSWPPSNGYTLEVVKTLPTDSLWSSAINAPEGPVSVLPNQPAAFFRLHR